MSKIRALLVIVLLFVGTAAALVADATIWANRTVFNTDQFVTTANRVLDEPEVQQQLAVRLSDTLIEQGQVQERLESRLGEQSRLAPILTSAARSLAYDIILRLLESDALRDGLNVALTQVHQQVLRIIEDEGAVTVKDDQVVLDLKVVLRAAADQLGIDPDMKAQLPEDAGQIVLVDNAKTAGAVQQLLSLHNVITWAVIGLAVGAFALAVIVANDRLATLRTVGILLVICGVLSSVLLLPLRPTVAAFADNGAAARAAFDAFFLDFRIQSLSFVALGIVVFIVAVLIGDGQFARAVRGAVRKDPSAPGISEAIRASATSLRVGGLVIGALLLAIWPEPSSRFYVGVFALLAAYFGVLWIATGQGSLATSARQQITTGWGRVSGSGEGELNATFAGRYAMQLRAAGLVLAVVACFAVPNFGIGALAAIIALTLVYLAAVDWLATRPA